MDDVAIIAYEVFPFCAVIVLPFPLIVTLFAWILKQVPETDEIDDDNVYVPDIVIVLQLSMRPGRTDGSVPVYGP